MDYQSPSKEVLESKARQIAEESVFDWSELDEPTREWYVRSIIEIWVQNPKVMQAVFKERVN